MYCTGSSKDFRSAKAKDYHLSTVRIMVKARWKVVQYQYDVTLQQAGVMLLESTHFSSQKWNMLQEMLLITACSM